MTVRLKSVSPQPPPPPVGGAAVVVVILVVGWGVCWDQVVVVGAGVARAVAAVAEEDETGCPPALVAPGTAGVWTGAVLLMRVVVGGPPLVVGPGVVVGAGVVGTQHWVALTDPSSELDPGGQGVQVSLPSSGLYVALGQI